MFSRSSTAQSMQIIHFSDAAVSAATAYKTLGAGSALSDESVPASKHSTAEARVSCPSDKEMVSCQAPVTYVWLCSAMFGLVPGNPTAI